MAFNAFTTGVQVGGLTNEEREMLEHLELGYNFFEEIQFDNVESVSINYAPYHSRPIIEAWVLDGLEYYIAEPVLSYDTTNETVTVSFGSLQTGYLILK